MNKVFVVFALLVVSVVFAVVGCATDGTSDPGADRAALECSADELCPDGSACGDDGECEVATDELDEYDEDGDGALDEDEDGEDDDGDGVIDDADEDDGLDGEDDDGDGEIDEADEDDDSEDDGLDDDGEDDGSDDSAEEPEA